MPEESELSDVNFDYPNLSSAVIMFIGFSVSLGWVTQQQPATVSAGADPAAG